MRDFVMKTKIIYISGSEIFDMADIRAAFEEVRSALNLDKSTVLFGVPVDAEDAGFAAQTHDNTVAEMETPNESLSAPIVETQIVETITEIIPEPTEEIVESESVATPSTVKKRGRPRKEEIVETPEDTESPETEEEKIVPILSVLATNDADVEEEVIEDDETEPVDEVDEEETEEDIEIIPEMSATEETEETDEVVDIDEEQDMPDTENIDDDEAGLEKLLSAMKPLEEDILDSQPDTDNIDEQSSDSLDISVDATLEQLATEFAENQDKIAAESKSNSRSKIGKLRNILPFKQSKHKDQGLGDLFGWAGIAANDEDFSVPGFFTSAASKK